MCTSRLHHSWSLVIIIVWFGTDLSKMPFLTQPSPIYPGLGPTLESHWHTELPLGNGFTGIQTSEFYLRLTLSLTKANFEKAQCDDVPPFGTTTKDIAMFLLQWWYCIWERPVYTRHKARQEKARLILWWQDSPEVPSKYQEIVYTNTKWGRQQINTVYSKIESEGALWWSGEMLFIVNYMDMDALSHRHWQSPDALV